jgi:hypothetical protein
MSLVEAAVGRSARRGAPCIALHARRLVRRRAHAPCGRLGSMVRQSYWMDICPITYNETLWHVNQNQINWENILYYSFNVVNFTITHIDRPSQRSWLRPRCDSIAGARGSTLISDARRRLIPHAAARASRARRARAPLDVRDGGCCALAAVRRREAVRRVTPSASTRRPRRRRGP